LAAGGKKRRVSLGKSISKKYAQIKSISERFFFTTVRIDTVMAAGQGAGSGCFFHYQRDGWVYPFIVTNRNIINGTKE
jgi:hypothetical protein